jgi:hypothetical protein
LIFRRDILKKLKSLEIMATQNNKFARQNEQTAKRNLTGEEKVSFDQQLARLEEDIRRLKIEYDIFFNGGAKRAPYDTKNRVETTLKRLGDERSLSFAQRYHYNSLMARYNSFRELWRRTIKGREEGKDAIVQARAAANAGKAENPAAKSNFVCSDVANETETVEKVYKALLAAKAACGENAASLSFAQFRQQLAEQTKRFMQINQCDRVWFEVGAENGRVVFKAKASK